MPIAKAGMLFMKKFAKCSAATTTSASGRAASIAMRSRSIAARNRSRWAGSARSARAVTPGAWLQTPAKTSGMRSLLDERVDAGAHRPMPQHALAHGLEISVPLEAAVGRVMHEDLAVDAEHVEQSDVGLADRLALLAGQLVRREHRHRILLEPPAQRGIPVGLIERLLQVIKAHDGSASAMASGHTTVKRSNTVSIASCISKPSRRACRAK